MKKNIILSSAVFAANLSASQILLEISGNITDKTPGWSFAASAPDKKGLTYNEFEGYYPDKGGKLFSSAIKLDKKSGTPAYYRISFTARANARSYQGIDFFDAAGNKLPDLYDVVYPGKEHFYDRVFYAAEKVESIQLFFQSKEGCSVRDLKIIRCSYKEAAEYCDRVYNSIPQLSFTAPADSFKLLPRTADALESGRAWKVLMLGDSIVQDTFHSQFHALIKRKYPRSDMRWQVSMRGSTGCWYYRQDDEFRNYVAIHKPDLLIIGGISNYRNVSPQEGTAAMKYVAEKARRELGCEVLLLTAALSYDVRDENNSCEFGPDIKIHGYDDPEGLAKAAEELNMPLWNLTVPCYSWLFSCREPHEFYSRDTVHSGEKGKQLIGRVMYEYFKTAF